MKIYDCILYNGESLMLDMRLRELRDLVHKHVIVEGLSTFRGAPKEPRLPVGETDRMRVVHVDYDETPEDGKRVSAWDREAWFRNSVARAIEDADPYDLILLSDADEIPRRSSVIGAMTCGEKDIISFRQSSFVYQLNLMSNVISRGTHAVLKKRLDTITPQEIRTKHEVATVQVPGGGWHFSYIARHTELVEAIKKKVKAFSHNEFDDLLTDEHLRQCINERRMWWMREAWMDRNLVRVEIDDTFPYFMREATAGALAEYIA